VRFDRNRRKSPAAELLPGNCSMSIRSFFHLAVLSLVLILGSSAFACAQPSGHDAEIQFDISAQPLDAALEAYMQVTGLQVLYRSALTASQFSSDVKGRFTPSQALAKLLAGTSLRARYTTDGAFTVFPTASAVPDASEVRQIAAYEVYLGNAQHRVVVALCQNAVTRPGGYRAALQLSIGQSGLIDDASLLDTTGDRTRDQTIVAVLHGLPIGQTPCRSA
jgi:hypothetical protein